MSFHYHIRTHGDELAAALAFASGLFFIWVGLLGVPIVAQAAGTAASSVVLQELAPEPSATGQTYAMGAKVSGLSGHPTGTVDILINGTPVCSGLALHGNNSSFAMAEECSVSDSAYTTPGTYSVTASYSGDATYAPSTSVATTHSVVQATTTTTITNKTALLTPSMVGNAYDVAVSVVANTVEAGTPDGDVTVSDGTDSCQITLTAGSGSCSLTSTSVGAKTLTATYSGTTNFAGSADTAPHEVVGIPVISSLAVTPDPAKAGTVSVAITFSNAMDTTTALDVAITGVTGSPLTVTQTTYSGTTWTGTAVISPNNEEAIATVAVSGGKDVYGTSFAGDTSHTFAVDTVTPSIVSLTSDATSGSWLTIGGSITFTLTPAKAEPTATVDGSYNGRALTWSTSDGGVTYTATYTVADGDTDQMTPLQITGVTMTDAAGNVSAPFDGSDVTDMIDGSAPSVTVSSDVYASSTVALDATVSDESGTVNIAWTQTSGPGTVTFSDPSIIAPTVSADTDGSYTLQLVVTDDAGNATTKIVTLHWDATPPSFTFTPSDMTLEATGTTTPVTFTPTATDAGGSVTIACDPSSGSGFTLGTTTVTCTASDPAGNTATASFDVGITDTTPPSISLLGYGGTTTVNVLKGNTYVDPGYVASDLADGDDPVIVAGTVDTSTEGSYLLTYDAQDSSGNAAVQQSRTVTVEDGQLTLATSTNPDTTVSGVVTNPFVGSTTANGVTTHFYIPAGALVTGTSTWDGVIALPTPSVSFTSPTADSGKTLTINTAVEVGTSSQSLTFDSGVRIVFVGQANAQVGYSHDGTFTEITNSCSADSQTAGDALPAGGDCKIAVGNDLVVWTKHFTTFVTYTQTAPQSSSTRVIASNGPIMGGGGGGGPVPVALPYNGGAAPGTTTGQGNQGQVLGANTYNFTRNLMLGMSGDDVAQLQRMLIAQGFGIPSISNGSAPYGYFGAETKTAVVAYQQAHGISPASGFVGQLTRTQLNQNSALGLTDQERAQLLVQLQQQLQLLLQQIARLQATSSAQ